MLVNVDGEREHVTGFEVIDFDGNAQAIIGDSNATNVVGGDSTTISCIENKWMRLSGSGMRVIDIEKHVAIRDIATQILITINRELSHLRRFSAAFEGHFEMVRRRILP